MSTQSITLPAVQASAANNRTGYRSFTLGSFQFSRDEYFVHVSWPAKDRTMSHTISVISVVPSLHSKFLRQS
jgi:preprotein translocase subunit SecE